MTRFVSRVELHGGTWDEYEKLHAAMVGQGFLRKILASDGVWHDLPPAEYCADLPVAREQAIERVRVAASSVKATYSALVTESVASIWYNLPISA